MANEDIIMKLSMIQQEAGKIEEQINSVNQQIQEFQVLKLSLGKIMKNEEILASLGKGVYFNAKVQEENLLVNIGNNLVVKKNPKQAGEIIDKQIINMETIKKHLLNGIQDINLEMMRLVEEVQSKQAE